MTPGSLTVYTWSCACSQKIFDGVLSGIVDASLIHDDDDDDVVQRTSSGRQRSARSRLTEQREGSAGSTGLID